MIYEIDSADYVNRWGVTGHERIIQNVMNLIRTRMYEVPFNRLMGVDPDIIDSRGDVPGAGLAGEITDMITRYESRANVLNVEWSGIDGNGNLLFKIELEV